MSRPSAHAWALAALLALPAVGAAAERGQPVQDVVLPSLSGGQVHLLPAGASVHVLVFVKPNHPRCLEALQELAGREGKPSGAHWVAILPKDTSPDEARALAAAGGMKIPFVFDLGDKVYGGLGISLHPSIAIVDRQGRFSALEPYRRIQYADRVTARIRFTLGEITAAQLAEADDPARAETRSDEAGVARHHEKFATQLLGLGQLDQALAEADKGVSMTPSASGYTLQARILKRLGRCEDATRALDRAAKLEPSKSLALAEQEPCPLPGSRSK